MKDLPSFLVRLGHVLESSRSHSEFVSELSTAISRNYTWTRCRALPDDAEKRAWESRAFLRECRPSRGLSEDAEEELLVAASGRWADEGDVKQFCLIGACLLKCANRAGNLAKFTNVILRCLAGKLVVALAYRWKGFDVALSWANRRRAVHNLLGRTLLAFFPQGAAAAASAALGADREREGAPRLERQAKGAACAKYLVEDLGGTRLKTCLVINKVFQSSLNWVFAAEEKTCTFADLAAHNPWSDPMPQRAEKHTKDLMAAMEVSVQANLAILDGARLRQLLTNATRMLQSFASEEWIGAPDMDAHQRQGFCGAIAKGMADAVRRHRKLEGFKIFSV